MRKDKNKNKAIEIILEILERGAELTMDLCDIFFCSYYESYRRARRDLLKSAEDSRKEMSQWRKKRQSFYSLTNYLKREGFIKRKSKGRMSEWTITYKGKKKLEEFKVEIPSPYEKKPSGSLIIFSYDVPEKIRKERNWIREIVKLLDFKMVHRSVWIGTNLIPEEFLEEIAGKGLEKCVHIFEVGKKGTLKRLF